VIRKVGVILLGVAVCLLGTTSALAMKYNESPMLKTKVAAGLLPPVEERLPEEPKVLSAERNEVPKENLDFEIGQYGGMLRMVHPDVDWDAFVFCLLNEPLISGPGILGEDIKGNILKDFEVSEDEKVFTFHMRKGLKWSDGVPVTTEDVLFAYEDVLLNEKLTPVFPRWLKAANKGDGEPMKLEVIDDYTFRISFTEPYGGFPVQLAIASWRGYTDLLKPKHYLKKFHPRYTPLEELEPLIKKEGLTKGEWWTLFNRKDHANWEFTNRTAIGFPVLTPFMIVKATQEVATFERNPYYFKVDSAGNQLPYIDKIRTVLADPEMCTMKIVAGEVNFAAGGHGGTALQNLPLYKENAEKGGYRVELLDMHVSPADISLNLTYPDPVWRKVVRDVRFRKALNMAINREEIVDAVYLGFAEPATAVPNIYNPEEANRLLDEIGLDKRDADGWRLGPDGKTFVIPFEISAASPDLVPVTELVVEYFKAVGIKTTMKVIDNALRAERKNANELQAQVFWTSLPVWHNFAGFLAGDITSWPLWDRWYNTGGKEGEEPPADVKRFLDLVSDSLVVGPEKRQEVINEYRRLLYENIYFMPTVEKAKYPVIVAKNMGNIPHKGFALTVIFSGEQVFFKH